MLPLEQNRVSFYKKTLSNFQKSRGSLGNPNYKDGRTLKQYYCSCGKELSSYQAKQCRICANKATLSRFNHLVLVDRSGEKNPMFGVHRFGELNPNYKNNKIVSVYPLGWNKTFKEQIRYRDGYKCQECGVHESDCLRKLHVHHIDYNKENISPNNLISLCHHCHAITTVSKVEKKLFWTNYYRSKRD